MWTRAEVKTRAKDVLRNVYWTALIICLILYMTGTSYFVSIDMDHIENDRLNNRLNDHSRTYRIGNMVFDTADYSVTIQIPTLNADHESTITINSRNLTSVMGLLPPWLIFFPLISVLFIIVLLSSLFLRILIGYAVQVGGYRYFLHTAQNRKGDFGHLFFGFNHRYYWNILQTMLLRDIFIFLWGLLFIIPGIIKKYSYAFTPYILAENPEMDPHIAIRMSMDMTRGHKWDMFVLNLSFLGWYILGSIFFRIGVIFVWPYETATFAQLYLILKKA